jgi:mannose-6-phosphate isomerase-like protein (cupin superfamily)
VLNLEEFGMSAANLGTAAGGVVGRTRHAVLLVRRIASDLSHAPTPDCDEVMFVLGGAGVVVLNGVRDLVEEDAVIVVPEGTDFAFQTRDGKPVTVLSVVIHGETVADGAAKRRDGLDIEPRRIDEDPELPTGVN